MHGFYWVEGLNLCNVTCEDNAGYYIVEDDYNNYLCLKCSAENCNDCPKDVCISCTNSTFLNSSKLCSGNCPTGYYQDVTICTLCDISCLSCTGPGNGLCLVCNDPKGYYLFLGLCVNKCPYGSAQTGTKQCGCE